MSNEATITSYQTKAVITDYSTDAVITAYQAKAVNIIASPVGLGEQPISSIKTTAQFYNEIRLETGYSDTENVNPLTNFADSAKPNATQATPSKRGQYVANDINGYPSILMDGVDDFYDMGDTYEDVFNKDHVIVLVLKRITIVNLFDHILGNSGGGTAMQPLLSDNGGSVLSYRYGSNNQFLWTDRSYNPFASVETPYFTVSFQGKAIEQKNQLYYNETFQNEDFNGSIDFSLHNPSHNMPLGARVNNVNGVIEGFSNIKLAAIAIFGGAQATDANRQNAESEFKKIYTHY